MLAIGKDLHDKAQQLLQAYLSHYESSMKHEIEALNKICPQWQSREAELPTNATLQQELLGNSEYGAIGGHTSNLRKILQQHKEVGKVGLGGLGPFLPAALVKEGKSAETLGTDTVTVTYALHLMLVEWPGLNNFKAKVVEIEKFLEKIKTNKRALPAALRIHIEGLKTRKVVVEANATVPALPAAPAVSA